MEAINDYLKVVNESRDSVENNAAKVILLYKIKDRAFKCKFDDLIIDR
jgi:hypothetical protein